ncbi:MAG: alpha/beta fold hydrolase [Deltaproteobacteria bacterium]|nr:alpha/beta fold hydrolase [Deltaproteobacteria bacterium]
MLHRFNTNPIDRLAELIGAKIERLGDRHGFDKLHIVGHSKGGILARRYVQHFGGDRRAKSVTTLGSLHHGTPTALMGVALSAVLPQRTSAGEMLPRSPLMRRLNRDHFPAGIPLTSIYSRDDLVCPYWYSILRPRPGEHHLTNVEVRGVGHSELTWAPGVYRHVRHSLEQASVMSREQTESSPNPKVAAG